MLGYLQRKVYCYQVLDEDISKGLELEIKVGKLNWSFL